MRPGQNIFAEKVGLSELSWDYKVEQRIRSHESEAMNPTQPNVLLQYLRKLASEPAMQPLSDRELLPGFTEQRDEAAFTTLVRRHGPMVLGLCQRLLQSGPDAEDVCQATFLVLASKAASPYWQPSVASWLYRVAYRLAWKAKAAAARRTFHERRVIQRPIPDPLDTLTGRELLAALDDELTRLPENIALRWCSATWKERRAIKQPGN